MSEDFNQPLTFGNNLATSKKKATKPAGKRKEKVANTHQDLVEIPENPPEESEELQRDMLDDFLFHAANYIYVRRKLFISLAIALAVIISSIFGVFRFIQYRDNLRNEELYAVEKIINNRAVSEDRQYKEAMPLLTRFIESHQDTKQYILARLYRGGLYASRSEFGNAEADFEAVRSSLNSESELYLLASLYLSNVLRDQSKLTQAIEVLQSAQTGKMTDVLLMEIAELYLQTGQKDKARETLDILLMDFPKSPFAGKAKQLLGLL